MRLAVAWLFIGSVAGGGGWLRGAAESHARGAARALRALSGRLSSLAPAEAEDRTGLQQRMMHQLMTQQQQPRALISYPPTAADAAVHDVPYTGGAFAMPPSPSWLPRRLRLLLTPRHCPQLIQGALLLSLAPYNLNATRESVVVGAPCVRQQWLVDRALRPARPRWSPALGAVLPAGPSGRGGSGVHVTQTIRSPRVCCVISWRARPTRSDAAGPAADRLVTVAFRGTKELCDVLTDIDMLPARYRARGGAAGGGGGAGGSFASGGGEGARAARAPTDERAHCHRGIVRAFESVSAELDAVLAHALPEGGRVLYTGHSLGGALAQLGAVHASRCSTARRPLRPTLVTFAAPAIGNRQFVSELNAAVEPHGGLRVHNQGDPVPSLSRALGYRHGGVSLQLPLAENARRAYASASAEHPAFGAIAPHVLYHIGHTVYGVWTPTPRAPGAGQPAAAAATSPAGGLSRTGARVTRALRGAAWGASGVARRLAIAKAASSVRNFG